MTTRKGQPGWTTAAGQPIGQLKQNSQKKTARTGQPGLVGLTGQPGQVKLDKQRGQERKDSMAMTSHLGQGNRASRTGRIDGTMRT